MLHAARWKCRTQKVAKKLLSGHHRTPLLGCVFATKARINSRKKLVKQQYVLHMSLLYVELGPTNGLDLLASLGHPSNDVAQRRSTKLCRMFDVSWAGTLCIHFRQLLPHNRILPRAKFTLRPPCLMLSYWQRYCTALKQWARAKLCGIEHTAPPIFSRATIALGIGPHSSWFLFSRLVFLSHFMLGWVFWKQALWFVQCPFYMPHALPVTLPIPSEHLELIWLVSDQML